MQEPIRYDNLSNQVYEILKRQIVNRQHAPNSKLDINQIGKQLGVSRMPVMDAISRLETEGLVERRNRVGTYVTPLDKVLFEEMFETRLMIEMWATPRIVSHWQPSDLEQFRSLLAEAGNLMRDVTDPTFDYQTFVRYDAEFHLGLIALCGNSRVVDIYESLNLHAQAARVYSLRARSRAGGVQDEHLAILDAFAAHDVERAQAAQRRHIERSRAGVLALLEEHGPL